MEQVNICQAKTHFSKYVEKAASGEDIVIAKGGRQRARLTTITRQKQPVRYGILKDSIRLNADFDEPLPDEVVAGFEGR